MTFTNHFIDRLSQRAWDTELEDATLADLEEAINSATATMNYTNLDGEEKSYLVCTFNNTEFGIACKTTDGELYALTFITPDMHKLNVVNNYCERVSITLVD